MKTRRYAALAATLALALAVAGAGVYASWSEQGRATQNLRVGTFGMRIVAATDGAIIAPDGKSVTYTVPEIRRSAASSAPFDFTVELVGEIPARVAASMTGAPAAPFFSLPLVPAGDTVLHQGERVVFQGGIGWPELGMADLARSTSITYTVDASEGPPRATVVIPTVQASACTANNGGINIPSVVGADYFIGGALAPSGFNARPLGTYQVTAVAQAGYDPVLVGYPVGGWSLAVNENCPPINTRTWNHSTNEVEIYVHVVPGLSGATYTVQPGDRLAFFRTPGGWWPSFNPPAASALAVANAGGIIYWKGTVPAGTTQLQVTVFDSGGGLHTWYPTPWS